MNEELLLIDDNCVVSMHYRLNNGFGELIDSSQGTLPLVYMHNTNILLPSLERELTGKQKGDQIDITIYPEDGYGYANEDLIQEIPRSACASVGELNVGMRIKAMDKEGNSQLVTVVDVNDETVVADANHPLAGQVLHFQVAIVDVREPTAAEIAQGFASSTNSPST